MTVNFNSIHQNPKSGAGCVGIAVHRQTQRLADADVHEHRAGVAQVVVHDAVAVADVLDDLGLGVLLDY